MPQEMLLKLYAYVCRTFFPRFDKEREWAVKATSDSNWWGRCDLKQKEILVDRSHLTKTPLDVSKTRLSKAREVMSSPPVLLGITAMIFVVVSRYTLKKGETID